MSQNKMANRKVSHHVEFERDTTEFVPYSEPMSPVRTAASSNSFNRNDVYLDEIALIKRQMIPRDATLKNRKMAVSYSPNGKKGAKKDVFWPECTLVPSSPRVAKSDRSTSRSTSRSSKSSSSRGLSSARSSVSRKSTLCSRASMFEIPVAVETCHVGKTGENAVLKKCQLKRGERYDLTVDNSVIAMEITDKHAILISYKE